MPRGCDGYLPPNGLPAVLELVGEPIHRLRPAAERNYFKTLSKMMKSPSTLRKRSRGQAWKDRKAKTIRQIAPFKAAIEAAEALGTTSKPLTTLECADAVLGVLVRMREKCNSGREFQELFDLLEKQGADDVGIPPSFKLFCGFSLMGDVSYAEGVMFNAERADGSKAGFLLNGDGHSEAAFTPPDLVTIKALGSKAASLTLCVCAVLGGGKGGGYLVSARELRLRYYAAKVVNKEWCCTTNAAVGDAVANSSDSSDDNSE